MTQELKLPAPEHTAFLAARVALYEAQQACYDFDINQGVLLSQKLFTLHRFQDLTIAVGEAAREAEEASIVFERYIVKNWKEKPE